MTRRKFDCKFKIEAAKLVTDGGVAVAQATRALDIAASVLRRRIRDLSIASAAAFLVNGQMGAELTKIAILQKGVVWLRAQRDIQKKARAYFAGEASFKARHRTEDGARLTTPSTNPTMDHFKGAAPQGLAHTKRQTMDFKAIIYLFFLHMD